MIKKLVSLFAFAVICTTLWSQDIKFDHIGLDDGLSQSSCISICKDSYGFYWLGTEDGLNRYDGQNTIIYKSTSPRNSLSNDRINYLHALWDDFVLIATNQGVDIYQHSTDRITKQALGIGLITSCVEYGDTYIVGNENGDLYKLTHSENDIHYERYQSIKKFITELEIDHESEELYLGTTSGAFKLNLKNNQLEEIYFGSISNENVIINDIVKLNDNVYFSVKNYGIYKYNSFLNPSQRVLLRAKPVSKFLREGNLVWMAGSNFLAQFKEVENKTLFRTFGVDKRFKDIKSLYKSKDGEVSIGTYDNGFYKIRNASFFSIEHSSTPGLGFNSRSIWGFREISKDSIMVLGDEGLESFSLETQNVNSNIRIAGRSFNNYNIQDLLETDTCYWVATFLNGLFYVDKRSDKMINYRINSSSSKKRICSNQTRKLFIDSKDRLWIGALDQGLSVIDLKSGKIRNYQPTVKNNIPKVTLDFYEYNGIVYLATFKGFLKYENRKLVKVPIKVNNKRIDQILDINEVGDGIVWLSTNIGLQKVDLKTEKIIDGFSVEDGFIENTIYGSVIDNNDDIWVSSNNGLAKVDMQNRVISVYNEFDGLQSREFNGTAFAKFGKNVFFGGINGVNFFNPDSIKFSSDFYPIYFQDLNVNFTPFKVSDSLGGKQINFIDELELDYTQNTFSIDCIIPGDRGFYEYEYRLLGYDKDWIALKRSNTILYRNVPSGTYILEVRSYYRKTNKYSEIRRLKIEISAPFWMQMWFWLLVVLCVIAMISWYIYSRIRSQKKLTLMLKTKVDERTKELEQALKDKEVLFQEVHHRVKNNLQLITSLLNLQAHSVEDKKALEAFEKSKDRVRSMALVHTKLYQNQETKSLNTNEYLCDLFSDISNSFRLNATVDFESHVDKSIHLSVETSVKLGLIVTEIYINAFKYGFIDNESPALDIWLERRGEMYWMKVSDNGPGFTKNHDFSQSDSLGREIVDALVEQLNGSLKVYNNDGANIEITFQEVI